MEDFKRKIDATKQWVALKAKDLETLTFIRAKLGELYDKMLENQMRMNQNDMQKMRAHVVCILFASLPEYMHKAAKKYTDRSKNKEDSDKKTCRSRTEIRLTYSGVPEGCFNGFLPRNGGTFDFCMFSHERADGARVSSG